MNWIRLNRNRRIGFALLALTACLGTITSARAQGKQEDVTKKIGLDQRLGIQIPMDLKFTDESGKLLRLGDLFQGRPVVLVPLFYGCQGSCLLIRDGVLKVVNAQKKLQVGRDFDVAVLSVHPKETPKMASEAKALWLETYGYKTDPSAWHFLVGDLTSIRSLTQSVGFRFVYDPSTDMVSHPTGIIVLTPDGVTSGYLTGVMYPALDFMQDVEQANRGVVGKKSPEYLVGCIRYDPATGSYRIVVENVLRLLGFATVGILAFSVVYMSLKYRTRPVPDVSRSKQGGPPGA